MTREENIGHSISFIFVRHNQTKKGSRYMSKSQALQKLAHKSRSFMRVNSATILTCDVIFNREKNMFLYEIIKI